MMKRILTAVSEFPSYAGKGIFMDSAANAREP